LVYKQGIKYNIKKRNIEKHDFEGILTFEYLQSEEDLLAPALYKEIITNEEIKEEEKSNLINYFLSFKNENLDNLFLGLKYFKYIPIEILSKYLARAYSLETEFYKTLNFDLMKSKMNNNYKTFIKLLYNGIEVKSYLSYPGKLLYRGSRINKSEIEKILNYKENGKLNNIIVFSKAFLSFSEEESVAMGFLGESDDKFLGILFVLENDNQDKQESNADIHNFSPYKNEKEILFFPGSSFIIKDIDYIDNNAVKIILNYNGKFKEKYNFIYGDKNKLNFLIRNNIITKFIAGKELEFFKDCKYLILEKNSKIPENNMYVKRIMKAKNLENNEIVYIKEIKNDDSYDEKYFNQLTGILDELKNIKGACSLKESFYKNDYFYMIVESYDDYLSNYLKKIKPKGLPANLIKKIFLQLKEVLLHLKGAWGERCINPSNIYIKYTNEKKNNFDVYLSENGIFEFEQKSFSYFFYGYNFSTNYYYDDNYINNQNKKKCENEFFNIGMTLYELYFNGFSFYKELDFILYKYFKDENKDVHDILDYDELNEYSEEIKKIIKKIKEIKENPFRFDEYNININDLISYLEDSFFTDFEKRRNIWIKNLSHELFEKEESKKDGLFCDLIYKLIGNNRKERITNYEDFYNHPFFSQYNY